MEQFITLLTLFLAGPIIGFIASFFGLGGGLIAIPLMYTLFPSMPPHSVLGTSLFMTFLVTLRNAKRFKRERQTLNIPLYLPLVFGVIITSLSVGTIAFLLPPNLIKKALGVYLLLSSLLLLIHKTKSNRSDWPYPPYLRLRALISGSITGAVTVITGIGGGGILMPLFAHFLKMPLHLIPFYSNMTMLITSLVGLLTYINPFHAHLISEGSPFPQFQFASVNFLVAIILFSGSLFTSGFAYRLEKRTSPEIRRILYVILMFILALKIFF